MPPTNRLDLLSATCGRLVAELEAAACSCSRVIGELLVQVAEHPGPVRTLQLGRGYLIPDYPLTQRVLDTRRAHTMRVDDEDADPREAAVLSELGFTAVVMLPFEVDAAPWGLVEVYDTGGRVFGGGDLERGSTIVAAAAEAFARTPA